MTEKNISKALWNHAILLKFLTLSSFLTLIVQEVVLFNINNAEFLNLRLQGVLFIGFSILLNLHNDIFIIWLVSQDINIKNQKRVIEIFRSTIWLSFLTAFIWPFLIKRDKNEINESSDDIKFKLFEVRPTSYVCKMVFLLLSLGFLGNILFTIFYEYDSFMYVSISIIIILFLADFIMNVLIIKSLNKEKNIKNQKKVIKILWSTIWLSFLTVFIWPFLIKKDNKATDKSLDYINFLSFVVKYLIYYWKIAIFLASLFFIGGAIFAIFYDQTFFLYASISIIAIFLLADFIINIFIIKNLNKIENYQNQKRIIKILWSTMWLPFLTVFIWPFLIKKHLFKLKEINEDYYINNQEK